MKLIYLTELEKGRKADPIGTIKEWHGQKFRKEAAGWKMIGTGRGRGRPAGSVGAKKRAVQPDPVQAAAEEQKKQELIALLTDVLDTGSATTPEQRTKYINKLKELGVDYTEPKDDEYIAGANLADIKKQSDFHTYDKYRTYVRKLYNLRPKHAPNESLVETDRKYTIDDIKKIVKDSGLDIDVNLAKPGVQAHAYSMSNDINVNAEEYAGVIVHELGHVLQAYLEKNKIKYNRELVEDIIDSPTFYGTTNGGESFAEHVMRYYTDADYADLYPKQAALLKEIVPERFDKLFKTFVAKVQPASGASGAAKTSWESKGLTKMAPDRLDALKQATIRRDRMAYGQEVQYVGSYHANLNGKKGTLVAIGDGGFAVIKMGAGSTVTAAWRDLKSVGAIKPHSMYDGLEPDQVYVATGEFGEKLRDTLDKKIGKSRMSYADLCREFKKQGFTLNVVGGTVRDILSGKADVNDIDFIFDGSDRELSAILMKINPVWAKGAVTNSHLGLMSFSDGDDVVDITPIHRYSPELEKMAKGWNLKEDALSRDLAMNSLQVDGLSGVLVDGTGTGLADIESNTINFTDPAILEDNPVYLLRAFKFLARGYAISAESDKILNDNIKNIRKLTSKRVYSFLDRQIGAKDGEKGLLKVKDLMSARDSNLWDTMFESTYRTVIAKYRGK